MCGRCRTQTPLFHRIYRYPFECKFHRTTVASGIGENIRARARACVYMFGVFFLFYFFLYLVPST